MLVFPVGGESPFGDILHPLGAYLHFDPYPVGTHHGRMQRLVAVGLGHRDPVAQPVGFRGVDVRDGGVYLPALGLFRGERQRLEHDADGKQVVYLLEGDLFALHLAPYRVDALYPPRDFVVDVVAVEPRDDRGVELADELLARRLGFIEFLCDLGVLLREPVLHAEVFQFAFDRIKPQPVGQRCEEVDRFARDLDLFVHRHRPQRAHVVQAVGDFDEDDPHVVREGQQHLAEIFGLFRGFGVEHARHLGQPVDHRGDFRPEDAFHVFHGVFRVLHDVVQ